MKKIAGVVIAGSVVLIGFISGCNPRPPLPATDQAGSSTGEYKVPQVAQQSEEGDGWEYADEIDPITNATTRAAKLRVTASDMLMAEIEFYCGPKQGMFGYPPFVKISTYDLTQQTGESIGGAPINEEGSIEYRFNGKPSSYSLAMYNAAYAPSGFGNEVVITFKQLAGGIYGLVKEESPIYVEDPNFVIRVPTNVGTLTQQISLETPSIKNVLTSCGIKYGREVAVAATREKAAEVVEQQRVELPQGEETFEPSFDCAKATTAVEKMICADKELSDLDQALTTEYTLRVSKDFTNAAALKTAQRLWLKERDKCATVSCLGELYHRRIDELSAL